jgi:hypothetical protein
MRYTVRNGSVRYTVRNGSVRYTVRNGSVRYTVRNGSVRYTVRNGSVRYTVRNGSVRYTVRNLRCTVTTDSILANSKTQNAFLFPVHAMFRHDCPPSGETCKYAMVPSTQKKTWRDYLPIDMLLSSVSVLVVAQPGSEVPEGLMNYPVYTNESFYNIISLLQFVLLSSASCNDHYDSNLLMR